MAFHVGDDKGGYISGWVLPDNPAQTPRIVAEADGRRVVIAPTQQHESMVEAGLHNTGLVGFEITEEVLPGLTAARRLRLIDQDRGVVFYQRREPRSYAEERLFAFEMREGEASYCNRIFAGAFHMAFPDLHQLGQEMRKACFYAKFASSVYIGGAICVRQDDPYMVAMDYRRVALLADPAELLMDIFLPGHPKDDPAAPARLARMCVGLNDRDREALNDPLTRRLTSLYVGETLERDAVSRALYMLSEFEAVGVESALAEFVTVTAAACEIDERLLTLPAAPPPFPLAEACRKEGEIAALLRRDFQVYDSVHDAVMAARLGQALPG